MRHFITFLQLFSLFTFSLLRTLASYEHAPTVRVPHNSPAYDRALSQTAFRRDFAPPASFPRRLTLPNGSGCSAEWPVFWTGRPRARLMGSDCRDCGDGRPPALGHDWNGWGSLLGVSGQVAGEATQNFQRQVADRARGCSCSFVGSYCGCVR